MKLVFDFLKSKYQIIFRWVFFVCLLLSTVFFSGYPLNNNYQFRQVSNIFFIVCSLFLTIYFLLRIPFYKKEKITSILKRILTNRTTIFFCVFIFIFIFSFLIHKEFSKEGLATLAINICLLTFSYCFINIVSFDIFIKYFRKIFPIIALSSLIIFLPSLFLKQPPLFFTFETSNECVYNNFFFITFQIIRGSNRNCGIFWEPGLYAIFLNIAFCIEFFDTKSKTKIVNLIIYALCLFTTFSTSGYIAFIFVIILCFSRCVDKALRNKIIIVLIASAILIALSFFLIPSVKDKVFGTGVSLISRLYGPYVNIQVFSDGLFFGTGCLDESLYFNEKVIQLGLSSYIDSQVSTFGYYITAYGLFGFIPLIIFFVFCFLNKRLSLLEKIVITLFVIIISNSEPLQLNLLIYVFLFYLIKPENNFTEAAFESNLLMIFKNKIFNSDDKNKTLARNSAGAIVVRGLAMLLGLITTSGYLSYFGDKKVLGVWFTILQIIVFILTFDLGIGNGLKNRLIEAIDKNDKKEISKLITSSIIPMLALSILCVALGILVCNLIDFHAVFNIDKEAISHSALKTSMIIIVVSIALQFFLKVVGNMFEALQKQFVANIFPLITNLLLFIFVKFVVINGSDEKLIVLSVVYLIVSNTPYLVGGLILFLTSFKGCYIKGSYFDKKLTKNVISLGTKFLLIQLSLLLINSCNSMILTQLYTSEAVPDYSVYQKLFNVVIVVCTLFTGPLWAIIAKAKSQNDGVWIKKLASLIKKTAILLIAADFVLIILLQPIFDILFSNYHISVNWLCAFVFGLHSIFMVIISLESSICNGLEVLKPQIIGSLIGVAIKIALTVLNFTIPSLSSNPKYWYLTQLFSMISLVPSVIIMTIYSRKTIKGLKGYENSSYQ